VLPHKASDINAARRVKLRRNGTGSLRLANVGVADGPVDVFAWTGSSDRIPKSQLPGAGDNFAVIDINAVGVRPVIIGGTPEEPEFGMQVAINTYGERSHPNYPAEFDVYIDADRDGLADFVIFNSELGGFAATGENVVSVFDLNAGTAAAYFYNDADLNSANVILTAPLDALGLELGTQFDFAVYAFDNYFTGNLTDAVEGMSHTLGIPSSFGYGLPDAGVPARGQAELLVEGVPGGAAASPSQTGLLLMYRDGRLGNEAATVVVK
jgi:hypothetical protein